jgi:hypothetical protein
MKKVFRRPSPAMVVAIAALIVALGGTAVAGGVLNKKKVNNIISNRAPGLSVSHAGTADNAGNSNTTSEITSFAYNAGNGSTNKTVLNNFNGLTLLASCTTGANNGLTVNATSSIPGAFVSRDSNSRNVSDNTNSNSNVGNTPVLLMAPGNTVDTGNGPVDIGFATGSIIYWVPGTPNRVTVEWSYDGDFGGVGCHWAGTAVGTSSGAPAQVANARSAGGSGASADAASAAAAR